MSYDPGSWLPQIGSRWVWEIEQDHSRELIEVMEVMWNGEEWWVRTRTLPQAPVRMLEPLRDSVDHLNEIERFWEAVTPVGGLVESMRFRHEGPLGSERVSVNG